ncbi:hypothetical protein RhiirA4_409631 [Rhizophagus irregularis]|uniref:Uncharacterized protein n=1 Tax=Rhizophagus irregularis TaxID=588596 RepID=A0A2I1H5K9_9GLOM|nr:hypothetical protein RhiirA4_409631 [Rhizophagus irregularis]
MMEEFFTKLIQFGAQIEESCRELRTTIESPALPISSGHQENYFRDMLVQSKAMMNEINSLEKTPNTKHHMNDLILATNNVYEKMQHDIYLMEEQLREFGLEGTFVPKSTIDDERTREPTEEIESKSTSTKEPSKFHPESERRFTPPVIKTFKRLSTQTQESPTLESFGLSDHALALLKAGTPELIKDYGIKLNSDNSKSQQFTNNVASNDLTPISLFERMSPRSSFPSLSSNELPECTQIGPITKKEFETLGRDIHRQISMEFLNQVIYDINEMVGDKHDLPDFPKQAWNEFTYDELLNEIGVGGTATIDIVLLALITLDRIVSRCSDPDPMKKRYRIL